MIARFVTWYRSGQELVGSRGLVLSRARPLRQDRPGTPLRERHRMAAKSRRHLARDSGTNQALAKIHVSLKKGKRPA